MTAQFQGALAVASDYSDPGARINVIKRAVSSEMTAADPTVRPRFTDYFNHTLAPDIVLEWPNESRERLLFLRPTSNPGWLLNDINFLSVHRPIVFTLEDLSHTASLIGIDRQSASLAEAASAAGTWITDSSGTETISDVRKHSPTLGLLSQALVRGGRGLAGSHEVSSLAGATEAGFAGASALSASATSSAVAAIERNLSDEQSGRLTRLLRAVWEGHGGDSAQFPPTATVGRLTEDDLSYLLRTTEEGSPDFWRRIGRAVTSAMLGRTEADDPSRNLQALMAASLEFLQAKGIRFLYEPLRLGESEETPRWLVSKGCLALRGLTWTAYVAARLSEEFPPPDPPQALDLSTLRRRAARHPASITQVRIRRGDRVVTYESKDRNNVLAHPGLSKAAEDLGVSDIEGIETTIPGGGNVGVDFSTSTAAAPTSGSFPLGSLMRFGLPLLADLSPEELGAVMDLLKGEGFQEELFTSVEEPD